MVRCDRSGADRGCVELFQVRFAAFRGQLVPGGQGAQKAAKSGGQKGGCAIVCRRGHHTTRPRECPGGGVAPKADAGSSGWAKRSRCRKGEVGQAGVGNWAGLRVGSESMPADDSKGRARLGQGPASKALSLTRIFSGNPTPIQKRSATELCGHNYVSPCVYPRDWGFTGEYGTHYLGFWWLKRHQHSKGIWGVLDTRLKAPEST